jgi:hypothetical protein
MILQRNSKYFAALRNYQRIRTQRNALLLAIKERRAVESGLEVWNEQLVCNYGLFVLTDDGRFTSQGLQQRMKPLENKRKARDAKAEKAARKKAQNSNTNSSFSAAQKTETNEKNSAKKVENTSLQLVDNERVAKASLEENSIVEKRIEEIKRKEKEATASEKESSSSGSKSSFWEGWLNEALGERSWLELQAIHSGESRRTANVLRIAHSRGSTTPSGRDFGVG